MQGREPIVGKAHAISLGEGTAATRTTVLDGGNRRRGCKRADATRSWDRMGPPQALGDLAGSARDSAPGAGGGESVPAGHPRHRPPQGEFSRDTERLILFAHTSSCRPIATIRGVPGGKKSAPRVVYQTRAGKGALRREQERTPGGQRRAARPESIARRIRETRRAMIRMGNRKALNPLDSGRETEELVGIRLGDKVSVEPGLYGRDRGRTTYRFG